MVHEGPRYSDTEFVSDRIFTSLNQQTTDLSASAPEFVQPYKTYRSTHWNSHNPEGASPSGSFPIDMQTPMPFRGNAALINGNFSKSFAGSSPTASPNNVNVQRDGPYIVACIPNRAKEVGFAKCNLQTMKIVLTQFLDDSAYSGSLHQLSMPSIAEVIFPATIAQTSLIATLRANLANVTFCAIARRFFSDVDGNCILQGNAHITRVDVQGKYLCLAALTALIRYVSDVQRIILSPAAMRIEYHSREEYLEMSGGTVRALQLVSTSCAESSPFQSAHHHKRRLPPKSRPLKRSSLTENTQTAFRHISSLQRQAQPYLSDFIDFTCTIMGKRFLLASIVQPLSNLQTIALRQEAVGHFLQNPVTLAALSDALVGMIDVERLIAFFVAVPKKVDLRNAAKKLSNILCLYDALFQIRDIRSILGQFFPNSGIILFDAIKAACSSEVLDGAIDSLAQFLDENWDASENSIGATERGSAAHLQHSFAIKQGINSILDTSRGQYREVVDRLVKETARLQETYAIPSLRLTYTSPRGYILALDASAANRAPTDIFLQRNTTGKRMQCTTREIANWNTQCTDLVSEILRATNGIADDIITNMQNHLPPLYRAIDAITLLDFLLSLATAARSWGTQYTQPKVIQSGGMSLENAQSPIVWAENSSQWSAVQPNSCALNSAESLIVLSGPNMSGKTSYLQLVGQMCVLTHIGSMVPATSCRVPMIDRICTRMGFDDNIAHDASSFAVEMIDIAHILCHASSKSLVLIDEVGRSTHHSDAAAISLAIMDRLLEESIPTVFVTHQFELHALQAKHANMKIKHFAVTAEKGRLQFLNKLVDGESDATHYGIELAGYLEFPRDIVLAAKALLRSGEGKEQHREKPSDWDILRGVFKSMDFDAINDGQFSASKLLECFACIEVTLVKIRSAQGSSENLEDVRSVIRECLPFITGLYEATISRRSSRELEMKSKAKEDRVDGIETCAYKTPHLQRDVREKKMLSKLPPEMTESHASHFSEDDAASMSTHAFCEGAVPQSSSPQVWKNPSLRQNLPTGTPAMTNATPLFDP